MRVSDLTAPLPFYEECRSLVERIWLDRAQTFSEMHNELRPNARLNEARLSITFYDSLGVSIFIRKLRNAEYSLLVPSGSFDRLYLLIYLLMSSDFGPVAMISSLRDRRNVEPDIPVRLRAIFHPDESTFVASVNGLIKDHCTPKIVPTFQRDALIAATFFLAHHEFAHVLQGHFEMREKFINQTLPGFAFSEETLGLSEREIYEGFEVHADQEAARATTHLLAGYTEHVMREGGNWRATLNNFAIGLALMISLLDHRSRSLDMPGDGYYPHPLVRWTIVIGAITEELPQHLASEFEEASRQAAKMVTNFINALHLLELGIGEKANGPFQPLSQLNADRSLIGDSVLFEYVIRSVERGRRIVFIAELMGEIEKLRDTAEAPGTNFMNRLRALNSKWEKPRIRSNETEPPA